MLVLDLYLKLPDHSLFSIEAVDDCKATHLSDKLAGVSSFSFRGHKFSKVMAFLRSKARRMTVFLSDELRVEPLKADEWFQCWTC